MWVLSIPLDRPPMTLNGQRRAHWQQVRKAKETAEWHVTAAVKRARIPHLERVHVTIIWNAPDRRRRDSDALAPFLKATLDALVKTGVLDDDNHQYVPRVTLGIEHDPRVKGISVTITEVD